VGAEGSGMLPTAGSAHSGELRLFGRPFGLAIGVGVSTPASPMTRTRFGSVHWRLPIRIISPPQQRPLRLTVRLAVRRFEQGPTGSALVVAPAAGVSLRLPNLAGAIAPSIRLRAGPCYVAATGREGRLAPGVDLELRIGLGRTFAVSGGYQAVRRLSGVDYSSWSLDATVRLH